MKTLLIALLIVTSFTTFAQVDDGGFGKPNARVDKGEVVTAFGQYFVWDRGGSFGQQTTLYNDIDLSSYDLLSANLTFSDKDQAQKVVIAPFRLSPSLSSNLFLSNFLANTRFNIALKDKITTFGIGFGGDNSAPMSNRAKRFAKKEFETLPEPRTRNEGELFADYERDVLKNQDENVLAAALLRYDEARMRHVFKWSVGYNVQLFPVLFGSGDVNGFDTLNYYGLKSHNISASITSAHWNNRIVVNITYNHIFQRTTAVKGQKVVPYYGPSAAISGRIVSFLSKERLSKLDAYKKSLFVPSINLGLSWEGKFADGADEYKTYYQDKTEQTSVFTPFIDILITPAAQFRIAFPITKSTFVGSEEQTSGGASLQYNLKLSNLSL